MTEITLSAFNGINNTANEVRLPDGFVRECVDMNVDNSLLLSQRGGYALKNSGVFSCIGGDGNRCFAVKDGALVEIVPTLAGYGIVELKQGFGTAVLDFAECNGDYYFVGESHNGVIRGNDVLPMGLPSIPYQPTVTGTTGGELTAGKYLVAITALDVNGMESGTVQAVAYTLQAGETALHLSGIYVSGNARVTQIVIYVSTVSGSELFRQKVIANGTASTDIFLINPYSRALTTVGANPAPFGQLIAYHYGHLFIASGAFLFYSDKFAYERWRPFNEYSYGSRITAVLPCESGLWIGTEQSGLYWVGGKNPKLGVEAQGDFMQVKKHHACLFNGSAQRIDADFIEGANSHGWAATAKEGVFLLLDGGGFANVTQANVLLPEFEACAGAIIQNNDSFRYAAILRGANVPGRSV